jgi:hypothetical protein
MENLRKATPRQLAYIQQMRRRQGKESLEIDEDLGFEEASKNGQIQPLKINGFRLGMVKLQRG